MVQLKVKDLAIGYRYKPIVKGINFEIHYGDYVCILGSNGTGKTTLVKTILGLINPIHGKIKYDKKTPASSIGYLSQHLDVQSDFPAEVSEIVLSGCLGNHKFSLFYTKEDREVANKNMELLGITDLKRKSFQDLSGGQQQRVLLARALCAAKKMIILDEPFAGLDQESMKQLDNLIHYLNEELGITIILITHNFHKSSKYATKVIELNSTGAYTYTKEEYLEMEGDVHEHD